MRLSQRGGCCRAAAASCSTGHTSGTASRCCSATAAARTAASACISGSTNRRRLPRLLLLLLRVCLALWLRVVALRWRLQLQCCTGLWLRLLGCELGCHPTRRGVGEELTEAGLCRRQTAAQGQEAKQNSSSMIRVPIIAWCCKTGPEKCTSERQSVTPREAELPVAAHAAEMRRSAGGAGTLTPL
jgi:hypothetical protein